ncbi:hypothetical protein FHS16_002506 [Paenibacillus endophyticus]|uniref:Uncharacterized protein n=1 Tax=Paenibacillus endophyticus TaxID=1294268 RepID=A0A7W5GA73_9BACL|nr:hypothetical protein [Paenibacillus endophyticus]MBB3152456.1 hypothetical protein [Paenibacillus endophyticus]
MTTQKNTDLRFADPFTWEDLYEQQVNRKEQKREVNRKKYAQRFAKQREILSITTNGKV